MLRVLLLALGLSSTACSLVAVRGPPPNAERLPYLVCSASPTAPIIDSVLTGAMVAALASVAGSQQDGSYQTNRAGMLVSAGIGILAFGGSAAYGYVETAECRAAYGRLQERLNSPPKWLPPPPRHVPPPPPVAPPEPKVPPGAVPAGVSAAPARSPTPLPAPPTTPSPVVQPARPQAAGAQPLPFDSDEDADSKDSTKLQRDDKKKSGPSKASKKGEDVDEDEDESDDEDSEE